MTAPPASGPPGQPIEQAVQHPGRVLAVAFSPDGHVIASGCGDGPGPASGMPPPGTRSAAHCCIAGPCPGCGVWPRSGEGSDEPAGHGIVLVTAHEDMTTMSRTSSAGRITGADRALTASGTRHGPGRSAVADSLPPATWRAASPRAQCQENSASALRPHNRNPPLMLSFQRHQEREQVVQLLDGQQLGEVRRA